MPKHRRNWNISPALRPALVAPPLPACLPACSPVELSRLLSSCGDTHPATALVYKRLSELHFELGEYTQAVDTATPAVDAWVSSGGGGGGSSVGLRLLCPSAMPAAGVWFGWKRAGRGLVGCSVQGRVCPPGCPARSTPGATCHPPTWFFPPRFACSPQTKLEGPHSETAAVYGIQLGKALLGGSLCSGGGAVGALLLGGLLF